MAGFSADVLETDDFSGLYNSLSCHAKDNCSKGAKFKTIDETESEKKELLECRNEQEVPVYISPDSDSSGNIFYRERSNSESSNSVCDIKSSGKKERDENGDLQGPVERDDTICISSESDCSSGSSDRESSNSDGSTGLESNLSDLGLNENEGPESLNEVGVSYPPSASHLDQAINSGGISEEVRELFAQDKDGDTYLHLAVIARDAQLVRVIISLLPPLMVSDKPNFLDIQNSLFQTALHLAVLTAQPDIVTELMRVCPPASVDKRDLQCRTPLHIACEMENLEILQIQLTWLSKKANTKTLELKNEDGETCLHIATKRKNLKMASLLLAYDADINARDGKSGRTVLHFAAENGQNAMVDMFLQNERVEVDFKAYDGTTPIIIAYLRGHENIVKSLQTKVKLNLKDVMKYGSIRS